MKRWSIRILTILLAVVLFAVACGSGIVLAAESGTIQAETEVNTSASEIQNNILQTDSTTLQANAFTANSITVNDEIVSCGIDVSQWQGTIDWNKVKASGVEFVIIRAGYGRETSQKDPTFEANYAGAKAAGLKVGAYWYSYADSVADAQAEANACLQCIQGKTFDLPVFFDLEESSQFNMGIDFCSSITTAFCDTLKSSGYTSGLYISRSPLQYYINDYVKNNYPIWIAEYNDQSAPNYDGSYIMWQYCSDGQIEGINTDVDCDYYYGILNAEVTTQINSDQHTVTITLTGAGSCSEVSFPIWGKINGQNDLQWYQAQKNEDGTWSYTFQLSDQSELGTYCVHAYQMDNNDPKLLSSTTFLNTKMTARIGNDQQTVTLMLQGAEDCTEVYFPTWGVEDEQDDTQWYQAQKNSDGTWSYTFNISDHGELGTYCSHAYQVVDGNYEFLTGMTFQVVQIGTQLSSNQRMVTITMAGAEDCSEVCFPVWGTVDGQNDLKWYQAQKNDDGTWSYTFRLSDHGEVGTYCVHAYQVEDGVKKFLSGTTFQITEIPPPSVTAQVNSDQRTATITIEGAENCSEVCFPVWGAENGQNDLKWYQAQKNSDGTWSCTIRLSDHGELGTYCVHAYQNENGTLKFLNGTTFKVTEIAPPTITTEISSDQRFVTITMEGAENCSKVCFPVWGAENGQNDLKWYQAQKNSDGTWSCTVWLSDHEELGTYCVHAYQNENGVLKFLNGTTFEITEIPAPTLTAVLSEDKRTMHITLDGCGNYSDVQFPTWGNVNGQNDLQWYQATKNGTVWEYTVNLDSHGEMGLYLIHAYGSKGNGLQLIANTTVVR